VLGILGCTLNYRSHFTDMVGGKPTTAETVAGSDHGLPPMAAVFNR